MSVTQVLNSPLITKMRPAWDWWMRELGQSFSWLSRNRERHLEFEIGADNKPCLRADQSIKKHSKPQSIALYLESHRMQRRRITLPLSARKELNRVVQYEFNRYFPLEVDQAFYSINSTTNENINDSLSVEILCIAQNPVVQWMEQVTQQHQFEIGEVLVCSDLGQIKCHSGATHDLEKQQRAVTFKRWQNLTIAGLLLALAYLPMAKLDQHIEQQQHQIDQLTRQAQPAMDMRTRLMQHQKKVDQLREQVQDYPVQARIWSLVNSTIGDKAIIDRMKIRESEVTLTGISASVERVVETLERNPSIQKVKVNGSVQSSVDGSEEILNITFSIGETT